MYIQLKQRELGIEGKKPSFRHSSGMSTSSMGQIVLGTSGKNTVAAVNPLSSTRSNLNNVSTNYFSSFTFLLTLEA